MTWFANVHGGFEGPEGWAEQPALGLVDDLPEPAEDPPPFRRSLVLSGDSLPEGHDPRSYVALQKTLLGGTLPGFSLIAEGVPEGEGMAGVLCYQVVPPSGDALVQRQAYFFREGRVAVLTLTVRGDAPGDADEDFGRAVESFVFAG